METLDITAIVSTKNEELAIAHCLDALGNFDQVIVVDSQSADRTAEIVEARGVRLIQFCWNGQYPKKKQWILDNVTTRHPWILWVDADEFPSPEMLAELPKLLRTAATSGAAAIDFGLAYHFQGRELKFGHRVTKRILVHRDRVQYPIVDDLDAPGMGELEGHYQPDALGPVLVGKSKLIHSDPDPISSWVHRHNNYSDWEAALRIKSSVKESVRQRRSKGGRIFDRMPGKPIVFFFYCYIFRLGLLDGRPGLDYAVALSWYYWLTGAKTRELTREISA